MQRPVSNHGNSYTAFILAFFLPSCGIAISLALLSIPTDEDYHDFKSYLIIFSQSFGSLYTVCLIVLCLWFILRQKRLICSGLVSLPVRKWKNTSLRLILFTKDEKGDHRVHSSHHSPFQIGAFGVGSILYFISELVEVLSETDIDKIQIMKSITSLICCVVFIIFLRKYHNVVLKNYNLFHYFIAVMLGAEVCIWVSLTVHPLWHVTPESYNHDNNTITLNSTSTHNNLQHTDLDFEVGLRTVQGFLQPLLAEFISIAGACLLHLWQTMRQETYYQVECNPPRAQATNNDEEFEHVEGYDHSIVDIETSSTPDTDLNGLHGTSTDQNNNATSTIDYGDIDCNLPLFTDVDVDENANLVGDTSGSNFSSSPVRQDTQRKNIFTIAVTVTSGFLAVYLVTSCVLLAPGLLTIKQTALTEVLQHVVYTSVFGPLIIFILVSLCRLNKITINIPKAKVLNGGDYLLLCTSSAIFVYDILWIISEFGYLLVQPNTADTKETLFELCFWVGSIVHVWGQTQLILTVQNIYQSAKAPKMDRFIKFTLIYLVAINTGLWFCDSIGHKWAENDHQVDAATQADATHSYNSSTVSMFGEYHTNIILLVFLPVWDIYCFHSSITVYNLLKQTR